MPSSLNRRRFLLHSGFFSTHYSLLISAALSLAGSASFADILDGGPQLETLQAQEAAGLMAIASRILPEDESGPGALSGGVIHFIDKVLGSTRAEWLELLREGLHELDVQSAGNYGSAGFAQLSGPQQDELLRDIEGTEFFVTIRTLTIAGMFALPEYGGNMGHAGYTLIGFGHQHAWQPPFGHYDADYMARGE